MKGYPYWGEALHGIARANMAATDDHYALNTYTDTLGNRIQPLSTVATDGLATDFPNGLSLASSWDRDLVKRATTAISDEARAYLNIRHKGLTYWSPTVNLDRDPRWGRADESYGEDPYLTGEIGGAFVTGLQGNDPKYLKAVATPKHFYANNSEINRHVGSLNVSERETREYYTAQFAPLLGKYGAKSLMSSYNAVNGVPSSANEFALETLARRTWGFDGFVTSDCSAIKDINWGFDYTVDGQHEVATALKAGTDIDCTSSLPNSKPTLNSTTADYPTFMSAAGTDARAKGISDGALEEGLVSEADIDTALVHVFTQRFATGEFDNPAANPWPATSYNASTLASAQHLDVAQKASNESVVLLKNQTPAGGGNTPVLPLTAAHARNVVVVGYMATDPYKAAKYSPYKTTGVNSALAAIQAKVAETSPGATVTYINGLQNNAWNFGALTDPGTSVATRNGTRAYLVKPNIGAGGTALEFQDGGGASLASVPVNDIHDYLGWPGRAPYSDKAASLTGVASWLGYFAVDATIPEGTSTVRVLEGGTRQASTTAYAGTSIVDPGGYFEVHLGSATGPIVAPHVDANGLAATFPYTGPAGAQTLYFQYKNDSFGVENFATGHTATPASASTDEDLIRNADAVIVYVGTREGEGREEEDRYTIDLQRNQDQLVKSVAELNPDTIAYVQAIEEVNAEPFKNEAAAILWTSYNGQFQGDAAARILFGDVNPSGKLPFTWYSDVNQLARIQDYSLAPADGTKGRTYEYFSGDVSYPFGYGLSYSNFTYSNLRLNKSVMSPNDTLTATVDVTNESTRPGQTVVELYASSPHPDGVNRPKTQLKGFTKATLAAGEAKTVRIQLKGSDLWFWDDAANRETYDQGKWSLLVGGSSVDGLARSFRLSGQLAPAVETVAAIPDGVSLNTALPGNVIHANLSASRTDQSFYDLSSIDVRYTSSDPAVARVDAKGTVSPVSAGVVSIKATVTADGAAKSTTFPVVVHDGAFTSNGVTLFAKNIELADKTIGLSEAEAGSQLSAVVADAPSATYSYLAAWADTNTAGATVTPSGVLKATGAGVVRVTAVANDSGQKFVRTATVTVRDAPVVVPAAPATVIAKSAWAVFTQTPPEHVVGAAVTTTLSASVVTVSHDFTTVKFDARGLKAGTYSFTVTYSDDAGQHVAVEYRVDVCRSRTPGRPSRSLPNHLKIGAQSVVSGSAEMTCAPPTYQETGRPFTQSSRSS